jgi:Protein of unknown function (DUF3619)
VKTGRDLADDVLQQTREARVGLRLACLLSTGSTTLQPDIQERLRFAREQALDHVRSRRRVAVAAQSQHSGAATLALNGPPVWWQRVLAALPLALLLGGLVLVQLASQRELVVAAADIDATLLGDYLPPVAYSDPGFAEFLRDPQP